MLIAQQSPSALAAFKIKSIEEEKPEVERRLQALGYTNTTLRKSGNTLVGNASKGKTVFHIVLDEKGVLHVSAQISNK